MASTLVQSITNVVPTASSNFNSVPLQSNINFNSTNSDIPLTNSQPSNNLFNNIIPEITTTSSYNVIPSTFVKSNQNKDSNNKENNKEENKEDSSLIDNKQELQLDSSNTSNDNKFKLMDFIKHPIRTIKSHFHHNHKDGDLNANENNSSEHKPLKSAKSLYNSGKKESDDVLADKFNETQKDIKDKDFNSKEDKTGLKNAKNVKKDSLSTEPEKHHINVGAIIGGVVGVIGAIILFVILLLYFLKRRHQKTQEVTEIQRSEEGGLLNNNENDRDIEEVILSPIDPINKFWPDLEFNPPSQRNSSAKEVSIDLNNALGKSGKRNSFKLPNNEPTETIYERRMRKKSSADRHNYDDINNDVNIIAGDNFEKDTSMEICSVVRSSLKDKLYDDLNDVVLRSPSLPPEQDIYPPKQHKSTKSTAQNILLHGQVDNIVLPSEALVQVEKEKKAERKKYVFPSKYTISNIQTNMDLGNQAQFTKMDIPKTSHFVKVTTPIASLHPEIQGSNARNSLSPSFTLDPITEEPKEISSSTKGIKDSRRSFDILKKNPNTPKSNLLNTNVKHDRLHSDHVFSQEVKERRKKDLVKHLAGPPSTPPTPKKKGEHDFWGL